MTSLILWIILRILTSIFAAFASSLKPMTPIELRMPLLPPGEPFTLWLDRVFLSPWLRWDAEWYQRIVTHGYSASDGTSAFHPLYPWIATPFVRIGISPVFSLLIISSLAVIALFIFFNKLALIDLQPNDAFYGVMLFAFSPLSFILFAPYPEALFLLMAVLSLYFTRQKSWWLAGFMGSLATLTRQQGIFLLIPMAWELWENNDYKPRNILKQWQDWLALLLIPLGFVVWIIYRAFFLFDLSINLDNIQKFIYSFLISSSASQVVQGQGFLWPWQALYLALSKLFTHPDLDIWVNIIFAIIFLFILSITWRKMRISYRLYSLAIVWISFSFYSGPVHPYMGLPRHLFLAFPIFIGLAALIKKPSLRLLIIGLSAIGMFFLLLVYVINAWIP